jgi:transcriptional regulator with XRE-family HTH domain
MDKDETIGTLLRQAREARGLSMRRAAATLDVTPVTYESWEKDWRPPLQHIDTVAEFTGKPSWRIVHLAGLLDDKCASILHRDIPGYLSPHDDPLSLSPFLQAA